MSTRSRRRTSAPIVDTDASVAEAEEVSDADVPTATKSHPIKRTRGTSTDDGTVGDTNVKCEEDELVGRVVKRARGELPPAGLIDTSTLPPIGSETDDFVVQNLILRGAVQEVHRTPVVWLDVNHTRGTELANLVATAGSSTCTIYTLHPDGDVVDTAQFFKNEDDKGEGVDITSLAWLTTHPTADGRHLDALLALGDAKGIVHILSAPSSAERARLVVKKGEPVLMVEDIPGTPSHFVAATQNNVTEWSSSQYGAPFLAVRRWNADSTVSTLSVSSDGLWLSTAHSDGCLIVWKLARDSKAQQSLESAPVVLFQKKLAKVSKISCVKFRPQLSKPALIDVLNDDGTLTSWSVNLLEGGDSDSFQLVWQKKVANGVLKGSRFCYDRSGKFLVVGDMTGKLCVYNASEGELLSTLSNAKSTFPLRSCAFGASLHDLVVVGDCPLVYRWRYMHPINLANAVAEYEESLMRKNVEEEVRKRVGDDEAKKSGIKVVDDAVDEDEEASDGV